MPNLGVDFALPGVRDRCPVKRRERFAKLRRFVAKYRIIDSWVKNRIKSKVVHLYSGQLKPAVAYGASVNGLNDNELRRLRSALLAAIKPRQRGISLTLQLAVKR